MSLPGGGCDVCIQELSRRLREPALDEIKPTGTGRHKAGGRNADAAEVKLAPWAVRLGDHPLMGQFVMSPEFV